MKCAQEEVDRAEPTSACIKVGIEKLQLTSRPQQKTMWQVESIKKKDLNQTSVATQLSYELDYEKDPH